MTPETEFFVRHGAPPSNARTIGWDTLLRSEVYARPRTFPPRLLATFPIEGISTVVVGQPENTSASSPTDWVVILLHEHFHQLQEAQPDFYAKVAALGLSRGDQTGMWMLNYPFPYEASAVEKAYGGRGAGASGRSRRRRRGCVSGGADAFSPDGRRG